MVDNWSGHNYASEIALVEATKQTKLSYRNQKREIKQKTKANILTVIRKM